MVHKTLHGDGTLLANPTGTRFSVKSVVKCITTEKRKLLEKNTRQIRKVNGELMYTQHEFLTKNLEVWGPQGGR